jgi:nitrogen regulatory protein PII
VSVLGHIGYGVEKKLITAIVVSGRGLSLMELVENRPGVLSVTHHHARGTDSRGRPPGRLLWSERDVLMVLVEAPQGDEIFALLFKAAELGEPHQGVIFVEEVSRGHPMMPFAI